MSGNTALFIDDNNPMFADPVTGKLELFMLLDELLADGIISDENHKVLSVVRANVKDDPKMHCR